ncbi:MAG: P-loop NTPase fold protein, partial [Pseudomonadota bacterium]
MATSAPKLPIALLFSALLAMPNATGLIAQDLYNDDPEQQVQQTARQQQLPIQQSQESQAFASEQQQQIQQQQAKPIPPQLLDEQVRLLDTEKGSRPRNIDAAEPVEPEQTDGADLVKQLEDAISQEVDQVQAAPDTPPSKGWLDVLQEQAAWWSLLAILAAFLVLVFNRRNSESDEDEPDIYKTSARQVDTTPGDISEVGVTDAALEDPSKDLIGTSRLAKSLSLFLSHQKTEPPLTLAITGSWGSGKSSIMGMLKRYLTDARHRPVWFNVWHHQDEEHFFGALLENIRKEGIPPVWRFTGLQFRARLMFRRLRGKPMVAATIVLLVCAFLFPELFLNFGSLTQWQQQAQGIAGVLAALAILDQLAVFGFNSKDLLKGVASSFRSIDLDADAGLRYRVRNCLEDIDYALGNRSIVIFIDDLDRCPADHVLKVLEVV